MAIDKVMVILGGRSIGDILELLSDGRDFNPDLTYRYRRGSLGIAHAIGVTRDFVGDDDFCVVLGDNILRGAPLVEAATDYEAGSWDAGTLLALDVGEQNAHCATRSIGPHRGRIDADGSAPTGGRRIRPAARTPLLVATAPSAPRTLTATQNPSKGIDLAWLAPSGHARSSGSRPEPSTGMANQLSWPAVGHCGP